MGGGAPTDEEAFIDARFVQLVAERRWGECRLLLKYSPFTRHSDLAGKSAWSARDELHEAAGRGELHVLQWLYEGRGDGPRAEATPGQAPSLRSRFDAVLGRSLSGYAARADHVDCLRYLDAQGCHRNSQVCMQAAQSGHMAVLKYGCENGYSRHNAVLWAADAGRSEALAYLRERGEPWIESTAAAAVKGGRRGCFQFLTERGCPCDASTRAVAAARGWPV
jgi:hypothetical protein